MSAAGHVVAAPCAGRYCRVVPGPRTIPGYILAGGANRRFGSDKARALLRGEPLLHHAARSIACVADPLTVVADRSEKYADLGLRTIADATAGLGPRGGLERALEDRAARGEGWLLLTACDLLGVRAAWLDQLLDARRPGVEVVAFRGPVWQPMPALYHTALRGRLATWRGGAIWQLIERAPKASLPLPADWSQAAQINTPEDLSRYDENTAGGRIV